MLRLEEGIHLGIRDEDYHADPCPEPSLSSSIIRTLLEQSARHAWLEHPRLNPQWKPREANAEMDAGTIAHSLLLQDGIGIGVVDPRDYPAEKTGNIPAGWTNKAIREARDKLIAAGMTPVLLPKFNPVVEAIASLRDKLAKFNPPLDVDMQSKEVTLIWREGTVWCRARPDLLARDNSGMWDYKTTDKASPSAFSRRIAQMSHDIQAAWYQRGIAKLTGKWPEFFRFIPHELETGELSMLEIEPAWLELAQSKIDYAMGVWRECLKSGDWPGYPQGVATAIMPGWQLSQWEEMQVAEEQRGRLSTDEQLLGGQA